MGIKHLVIGSKVDVQAESEPTYVTKVDDIPDDGTIVISAPVDKFTQKTFRKGQRLKVCYYVNESRSFISYSNRYGFEAEVVATTLGDNVPLIILTPLTEPVKEQRRESYRLNVNREVITRPHRAGPFPFRPDEATAEEEHTRTENISESGSLIRTVNKYEKGDKLFIKLFLKYPQEDTEPLELACEIVQVINYMDGKYNQIGVRFLDITPFERDTLAKFVLVEQQKTLKRNKWLKK